jgi:hypothetical protein
MTLSIMALSKMALYITTPSIEYYFAKCRVSFIVMLSVVMLNVIMLSVAVLIVVMLNVVASFLSSQSLSP